MVIPAFNEESLLAQSTAKLHSFLDSHKEFEWEIMIADNASTDRTLEIAASMARQYPRTQVMHLDRKGRGGALKTIWTASTADILSYMDADLSTDLEAFPTLINALASGKYDVGTGSRLLSPPLTTRSLNREIMSRGYNLLVRRMLGTHFSDAQCGFKAITRSAAQALLPQVEDVRWFFDTELLTLAEKAGYRIFDLPVRWTECDKRASRVKVFRTVIEDLRGLIRLRRKIARMKAAHIPQGT